MEQSNSATAASFRAGYDNDSALGVHDPTLVDKSYFTTYDLQVLSKCPRSIVTRVTMVY
jgi:hypothetical protein